MDIAHRLTFRLTPQDAANVAAVAARMRETGKAFITRTEAIRAALEIAAESPSAPPKDTFRTT
jgi:hypothetical protein